MVEPQKIEFLLGKPLDELTAIATAAGLPRFAGKQLADWIYQKRATSFSEMTNISAKARETLAERYDIGRTEPQAESISADGTKKYLFEIYRTGKEVGMTASRYVESVYIPDDDRATICISTQAGCKMGCRFCMTGTLGFHGNLTATDILNQIFSIPDSKSLTNIVVMGEGEPCDNIDELLRALQIMTAPWGCAWSPRRITVSSVGHAGGLQRLIEQTDCHIAISLHNPFSAERAEIMPAEKAFPIAQVIELLKHYDWSHQRRLSFEYICFAGVNDTLRHATALRRLLAGLDCRVNLIRYHQAPDSYDSDNQRKTLSMPSSSEQQMIFLRDYLTQNGITTTIRRSRGEDILAACGMLVNQNQTKQNETT